MSGRMTALGTRLIGLGLWLATVPANRVPLRTLDTRAYGRWALAKLNEAWERDELARRHAKPSTRRRVK